MKPTSDFTCAQCTIAEPYIPTWTVGRPSQTNMREVLKAHFKSWPMEAAGEIFRLSAGRTSPVLFSSESTRRQVGKIHDTLVSSESPVDIQRLVREARIQKASNLRRTAGIRVFDAGKTNQRNQAGYYGRHAWVTSCDSSSCVKHSGSRCIEVCAQKRFQTFAITFCGSVGNAGKLIETIYYWKLLELQIIKRSEE